MGDPPLRPDVHLHGRSGGVSLVAARPDPGAAVQVPRDARPVVDRAGGDGHAAGVQLQPLPRLSGAAPGAVGDRRVHDRPGAPGVAPDPSPGGSQRGGDCRPQPPGRRDGCAVRIRRRLVEPAPPVRRLRARRHDDPRRLPADPLDCGDGAGVLLWTAVLDGAGSAAAVPADRGRRGHSRVPGGSCAQRLRGADALGDTGVTARRRDYLIEP